MRKDPKFEVEHVTPRFGEASLRSADIVNWAHRNQLVFPPTDPDIFDFRIVHIDSMFHAMERGAARGDASHVVRAARALLALDPEGNVWVTSDLKPGDLASARHYLRHRGLQVMEHLLRQGLTKDLHLVHGQDRKTDASGSRLTQQEAAVLDALVRSGLDPLALPSFPNGKPDPAKQMVKPMLVKQGMDPQAFENCWDGLRRRGRLHRIERPPPKGT